MVHSRCNYEGALLQIINDPALQEEEHLHYTSSEKPYTFFHIKRFHNEIGSTRTMSKKHQGISEDCGLLEDRC